MVPKSPSSPGNAQQRLAAQRAAAARARIASRQRRRRLVAVGGPVALALGVIGVLVVVKVLTGIGSPKSGQRPSGVSAAVAAEIASIPASVFDTVGVGTATSVPRPVSAAALTEDGKPRVLYVGAEYCPYCAAERWALAVALSRFGTFTGLGQTASSPSDVFPNTASLTFHGATYTSSYVTFAGRETKSNQVVNGQYAPLDTLSAEDQVLASTYDAPPYFKQSGAIPFVDLGGRYLIAGASYDPTVLQGTTQAQIAASLTETTSPIAKGIDGTANLVTAAICQLTHDQPGPVCQSHAVTAATATLAHGS